MSNGAKPAILVPCSGIGKVHGLGRIIADELAEQITVKVDEAWQGGNKCWKLRR